MGERWRLVRLGALATAVCLAAPSSVGADGRNCPRARLAVSMGAPGRAMVRCAGDVTPHVSVNGGQLLVADLSAGGDTATFYGRGTVVRLHQHAGRVRVLAVTVRRRAMVRVRFAPLQLDQLGSAPPSGGY